VGRKAFEDLVSSGEVLGSEEVGQVRFVLVAVREVAIFGRTTRTTLALVVGAETSPGWQVGARGIALGICYVLDSFLVDL
jgi:hypothetical protein